MAFYKNIASQKIPIYAHNVVTDLPYTGGAGNITAQISKDGAASAATNDANPTELDATNHKGVYLFDMTQTEMNADLINLTAACTDGDVTIDPVAISTLPAIPANFSSLGINASGHVSRVTLTDTTTTNTDMLTQANVRSAVGLGSANLDTQLGDIPTNSEQQAMFDALNQSASRRITLSTSAQYERPESGSSTYTVEVRTFNGDGAATNADSTPTVTPTGIVSGSLAANLGAGSNPATGVYRYVYTVEDDAAIEQIQMSASAVMSDGTFTIAAYPQVADFVAATFTTADRALLTAASTQISVDAIATNVTTALARLGAFTGTGVNTILGFFKALMSKAASTPSDVGGTFAAADNSTEKISETATAAAADALLARKIEEADMYTDVNTTPWQFVFMEKGTGGIGVGVEIMRKDIKTPAGVDVTADTTAIGQLVEP